MKIFWRTVVITLLADQLVKWVLLMELGIASRSPLINTPLFKLVMVWNQGVSFGILNHGGHVTPGLLMAVALGISFWLFTLARASTQPLERIAYGLIVGGALGNVVDRIRFGAVADFFYFGIGGYYWPAFNIADSAICMGVAGLFFLMITQRAKP